MTAIPLLDIRNLTVEFQTRRGLVMGLLSASTATGSLVFLPGMAALAESGGWRPVVITVSLAAAALIPLVVFLMPERPSDIGQAPYGGTEVEAAPPPGRPGDAVAMSCSSRSSGASRAVIRSRACREVAYRCTLHSSQSVSADNRSRSSSWPCSSACRTSSTLV